MRRVLVGGRTTAPIALMGLMLGFILCLGAPASAEAQEGPSEAAMAQANNPLAGAYALNLQNYYAGSLYGVPDRSSNTFWARAAIPIGRTLTRASIPLATRPSSPTEAQAGLGDFNIFTAYLLVSDPTTSLGIGPLVVAPTATDEVLGQGKWQLGAAAVAFKATPKVQVGGLITWQASVGGDSDRPSTSLMAVQPFAIWQLGGGTYLRSTGVWTFDLKSGDYAVPMGFGLGQVLKSGKVVYNLWLEPQFTILHDGTGQPKVQLFAGLNLQFPRS